MRRTKLSAYSGPLFLSIFLLASTVLHAQAPTAGTTVSVKMIDTVNSGSDPTGKQYRASVTKAVTANGIAIARGAAATVTLTSSGSDYAAQLSSIAINGQQVAVTSNSATVSAVAQLAQSKAASAVGSVLGGLGHHVSAPASVAAAAAGQHVSLPTGTTLTFVLGASPAAPAAQTMTASAAPASSAAATSGASAGGPLTAMEICFAIAPPDPSTQAMYLTAAFEVPVDTQGSIPAFEPAFSAYLKATYHYSSGITCQPIWSVADAQQVQKKLADNRDRGKGTLKVINTGWRYGQPPLTQGQSGFDPLALGPGGLDLTQHRLTTYMCTLDIAGGTTIVPPQPYNPKIATRYLSQVFQADWDSAPVSMAYKVYIRDHFVHDLNLSDLSPRCSAQSPAMLTMQHQSAMVGTKLIQHVVPVDFTDTTAEASGGNAALAQAASATEAAAAQTAAAKFYISCSTSGGAAIDTYYTGVFQIKNAKMTPRGVLASPESQIVLDHFYAYLTQKGYKFSNGSASACDIARTEAATKAAQHKRAYEGGGCSTCGKIVETGWKDPN